MICIYPINKEENIPEIAFSFATTIFGEVMVASSEKGICALDFVVDREATICRLASRFPNAILYQKNIFLHTEALNYAQYKTTTVDIIPLHIKGTQFQLSVWNTLLSIPLGSTATYLDIAKIIDNPKSVRAVGTAVGNNPVSLIIPCHRVIKSDGNIGNYHWGRELKQKILTMESQFCQPQVDIFR